MQAADYWKVFGAEGIRCQLCPHACVLDEGQTGLCHVRTVRAGQLVAAGYGMISSEQIDPIEKKPLHHFYPGQDIFSIGGWGCNFACVFCQNWTISQQVIEGRRAYTPEEVVSAAKQSGGIGVAYTYNEPLVAFEFVRDCVHLVHDAGMKNVLVTNGYINRKPAAELLPLIDALNIDVKSMDDDFYVKKCRGHVQPVLNFAEQAVEAGCHVEITNLLIPGLNDADELVDLLAIWMKESLGRQTPLHLSAYHPQFKLDVKATEVSHLQRARELAVAHLDFVYLGNVMSGEGQNTCCPSCGETLISRHGYNTRLLRVSEQGRCLGCGADANLIIQPGSCR